MATREQTATYELTVIESDEQSAWQRFALSEQWGQTEPHYVDGEQLGKNVVVVEIRPEDSVRFARALDRDPAVLSYALLHQLVIAPCLRIRPRH